jgi:anti-anti-sigma regulatory factor
MTATSPDPFAAVPLITPSVRRLGERTCVVDAGTELRHVDLPALEEAVHALAGDGVRDLVFDLGHLRRFDPFALVRLAREWERLADTGCAIHVAARDPDVVADLEQLDGSGGWTLHRTATAALRALLSVPVA